MRSMVRAAGCVSQRLAILSNWITVLLVIGCLERQFTCIGLADERPKAETPKLIEASAEAATAMGSFKKPAGWTCNLFAAEPMVGNPVAFTIDNSGRVIVCESYRQNK